MESRVNEEERGDKVKLQGPDGDLFQPLQRFNLLL